VNLEKFISDITKKLIEVTLIANGGNIAKTAEYFEMNRTTLLCKIKKYQIPITEIKNSEPQKNRTVDEVPIFRISGLNNLKMQSMLQALEQCEYNRTHAARALGISVRTLRHWVAHAKDSGIEIPGGVTFRIRKRNRFKNVV
jgi:DNA-binding NtrC family response regulator